VPFGVSRIVTFATGGARFGIRLEDVERVLRMVAVTPLPGAPPVVMGAIDVQGEVLAVADPARRLGVAATTLGPDAHLLLTRTPRRRLALAVSEVQGVVEVAADSITSAATLSPSPATIAGAVGLPDGLLFVHDMEAFLSPDEETRLDAALEPGR
jgi:purine-binding chemotaxis protein CheW